MANITIAVETADRDGIAPTANGSLSTSNTYIVANNGGRTLLRFKKTGAGACTVTFKATASVEGLAVADHTVTVPATTGDVLVSDLEPEAFNQSDGTVHFTLSEVTGLTVEAVVAKT